MLLETLKSPFARVLAANATDAGFPSRIPTLTQPTLAIGSLDGGVQQNGVRIVPFAVGADDTTFAFRVIGWHYIGSGPSRLWIPVPLGEFNCTTCTAVGVAGGAVLNTERFCDTIALQGTTANANVGVEIVSPANNTIAYVLVDLKGAPLFEVTFDIGTGPTEMNALYSLI